MPLQSLVLLLPLQRPMLPQALLPLVRHGGRRPVGAEGGRATLAGVYIGTQEEEKWLRRAPRGSFINFASMVTHHGGKSFRCGHVTFASHPFVFIC